MAHLKQAPPAITPITGTNADHIRPVAGSIAGVLDAWLELVDDVLAPVRRLQTYTRRGQHGHHC